MNLTEQQVFIANGYLSVAGKTDSTAISADAPLMTIINNINYYGFMPSFDAIKAIGSLDADALAFFWEETEKALKTVTADDRKMGDFVVYQNFPQECLDMTQCEYWFKQILMYFGFDKENFIQEPQARDPLFEKGSLKVLHLANDATFKDILASLVANKARWSVPQMSYTYFLLTKLEVEEFAMADVGFRENGIQAINYLMNTVDNPNIIIDDATDVLRLGALRSEADVSLREKLKFKSFSRSDRRVMCRMLDKSKHLEDDIAERPQLWKMFLRRLHPGDFRFQRVSCVYDKLYKGQLSSFASRVESGIKNKDVEVLGLLQRRPGEFLRRFHQCYGLFGHDATVAFLPIMEKLSTQQLLRLLKYVETINIRSFLVHPPKGNWNKLQIKENNKAAISDKTYIAIRERVDNIVSQRLREALPNGCDVDPRVDLIKLQTNDQELAAYGRGTVFEIPEEMTFLRTASYWENKGGVSWFDNSWNFFDAKWKHLDACCWNSNRFGNAAIFSGDPINSRELKGRACQMIDLYIDRLLRKGVRYAVWNILSFSRIAFSDVSGEVLATLQWGEKPQQGKLYEPGRAQMVFPLTGKGLTKYIAYIDLQERKLIYMDANLRGSVQSAAQNGRVLTEQMPAFLEYLASLPTVGDLFCYAEHGRPEAEIPILYSDADVEITDNRSAYVFRPENENNKFRQLDLSKLL